MHIIIHHQYHKWKAKWQYIAKKARLPPSCSNWSRTCQSGMSTWCHLPGLSPAEENCHMRPFPAYSVGGWFALSEYQSWIAPWVHCVRPSLLLYLPIIPSPAGCAGGCSLLSTSQSGIIVCFHAFLPFTVSPQLEGSSLLVWSCLTVLLFSLYITLHTSIICLTLIASSQNKCALQGATRNTAWSQEQKWLEFAIVTIHNFTRPNQESGPHQSRARRQFWCIFGLPFRNSALLPVRILKGDR